ncbi:MAG: D-sedoheptulose 7-phosphate isomerase [Nitrospiraceae bacterium]
MKAAALQAFEDSASVKREFIRLYADQLVSLAQLMASAFKQGRKVLFFGNGGSATDAMHLAAEFVGRYHNNRRALPALALGADTSALTCIANDFGYDTVFARQVEAHGVRGDIAVGISTSGNSPNVLHGVDAARTLGLTTVGWTGHQGGALRTRVDHCFVVPSTITARIQECHITMGHVLCELIEGELFGTPSH